MAGIADIGTVDVLRTFALGDAAVVTTGTGTDDLIVIDGAGR